MAGNVMGPESHGLYALGFRRCASCNNPSASAHATGTLLRTTRPRRRHLERSQRRAARCERPTCCRPDSDTCDWLAPHACARLRSGLRPTAATCPAALGASTAGDWTDQRVCEACAERSKAGLPGACNGGERIDRIRVLRDTPKSDSERLAPVLSRPTFNRDPARPKETTNGKDALPRRRAQTMAAPAGVPDRTEPSEMQGRSGAPSLHRTAKAQRHSPPC